jgi:hypothetical protein
MARAIGIYALAIAACAPAAAFAASVTEPGRNGSPPAHVAPNAAHGASPGSSMDAPGGVGPGFTNPRDLPAGIVAPGTIGRNGIELPDNDGAR